MKLKTVKNELESLCMGVESAITDLGYDTEEKISSVEYKLGRKLDYLFYTLEEIRMNIDEQKWKSELEKAREERARLDERIEYAKDRINNKYEEMSEHRREYEGINNVDGGCC